MENMDLYNAGREVPAEAIKEIVSGRLKGMSNVNPMWRIKRLTEIFGPCGFGWWYEIKDKRIVEDPMTKQSAAFVDIDLYYTYEGLESNPVPGTGGAMFVSQERNGPHLSDECYKMALTDAISVAAKAIGIGADVYYKADRDKYTDSTIEETKPTQVMNAQSRAQVYHCQKCGKVIEAYRSHNGVVRPQKHVDGCLERFGEVLCLDCISKREANENTD